MKPFDSRQSAFRGILQQLFPYVAGKTLDTLLQSVDADLTPPLKVDASNPANRIITVSSGTVSNAQSNRQRTIPHIQGVIPNFTSGTVVFPSADGGTITVSPGANAILNLPIGTFAKALLSLDSSGNIVVAVGASNVSQSNAQVPAPNTNQLPFAYVVLHNIGGTVQNVQQANIYQFDKSFPLQPSSGGSSFGWLAGNIAISSGSDTVSFAFSTPQPDTSYVILPTIQNAIDSDPQSLQVLSVIKSTTGFTVKLNDATDSANYSLNYIIPLKAFPMAEVSVSSAASSVNTVFNIADNGANYGLLAFLQNTVDSSPQFQSALITSKSGTGSTVSWNAPTDSSNYTLMYFKNATGIVDIGLGASSISVNLPVNYGNTNYAVIAMVQNLVDGSPQFQPLWISSKSGSTFSISWSDPTDSVNYKIVYYAISFA